MSVATSQSKPLLLESPQWPCQCTKSHATEELVEASLYHTACKIPNCIVLLPSSIRALHSFFVTAPYALANPPLSQNNAKLARIFLSADVVAWLQVAAERMLRCIASVLCVSVRPIR